MAANSQIAFNPQGETVVVAAALSAPLGVQALPRKITGQAGQFRIVNAGQQTVFLGVGPTAALAQSKAVAPIAGNPSPAIVIIPGAVEVFSFGEEAYFSGLASSATTVYIVPGSGI